MKAGKKKDEVVDLSTLPPWLSIAVCLNFGTSKDRAAKITKSLQTCSYEPKRFITREEIINYGKENQMYVDPTQVNEKQKKAPVGGDIPTELTPELLSKIFVQFYNEINIQGRKAKKEYQDAIAAGKDPNVKKDSKDAKKADKKDAKGKKVEEVVEEKPEEPPMDKGIDKLSDFVYFLTDYPATKEEFAELSKAGGAIDMILRINEQVIPGHSDEPNEWLQGDADNFEETLKRKMEEFIDGDGAEKFEQQKKAEGLGEEDKAFIRANNKIILNMKEARDASNRNSPIRNTVYKEYVALFDYNLPEEELLRAINLEIFNQLAVFSYDIQAYRDWIKTKKTEPLIPGQGPTAEELAALEAQRIQQEEEKRRLEEEAAKKTKKGGKDTKKEVKDVKKMEEEKKAEEKKAEEDADKQQDQQKQQEKKEETFDLSYYNQQLGVLDEESVTEGICIEAMLDQIAYSISGASETFSATTKELESIFSSIMHDIRGTSSSDNQADKLKKYVGSDGKSPYQLLVNESDDIQRRTYNQRLNNDDIAERREHLVFDEIAVPGINRKDMPPQATKTENLRKAEKSHINPFVTSDINDFERYLLLEEFENLMKTKDAKREWNFGDRTYEERFDKGTLRQVLYKTLLFEPDYLHSYYDKEDCLLVSCFYNKPPYRILRKKWNCSWRTLPNLENWIKFFKNSKANLSNEFFYDLDYRITENFHERVKLMYPNDDSVMICGKYCIGDRSFYHYKVVKENMIFGIENSMINGTKTAEVWVVLENQTRILVEMQKNEVKAPELTEEEQQELEEKRRKAEEEALAAAALEKARLEELARKEAEEKKKGTKKGGKDTKKAPKEEEKHEEEVKHIEPEQKEPEIPESYSATFTLTLRNGLVVKFLPNGDIIQTLVKSSVKPVRKQFQDVVSDAAEKREIEENHRIITGKGSVIKHMKDGSIKILYANGNTAEYKKTGVWMTVNNKGQRKGRRVKNNKVTEYEPLSIATKTDPQTGCKIWIREDQVMMIQYPNGFNYTVHQDGTRFLTYPKKDIIVVEHDDFASVKVVYDKVKERMGTVIGMGSAFAYHGFDNIMDRSNNGRVTETYLPDGTKVVGYVEKKELEGYNQFETSNIHLLYSADGSVIKIKETGEVLLISANDRYELNQKGENRKENDIDYFIQLFGIPEERKSGVFAADLIQRILWTKDDDGNKFVITSTGEAKAYIAVSLNLAQDPNIEKVTDDDEVNRPGTPDFLEGEYLDPDNEHLEPTSRFIAPRLFVVKNDDTGSELLNDSQLRHYFQLKEKDPKCHKIIEDVMTTYKCQSLTFLSELQTLKEMKNYLINIEIPKAVDVVPQTQQKHEKPSLKKYLYRNLLKYSEFDEEKRDKLHKDLKEHEVWKVSQKKEYNLRPRPEDDQEKEYAIQTKILGSRKDKPVPQY